MERFYAFRMAVAVGILVALVSSSGCQRSPTVFSNPQASSTATSRQEDARAPQVVLEGWAMADDVQSKMGYTEAEEGHCFIGIEFQARNVSPGIWILDFRGIQLRDKEGFLYQASAIGSGELQSHYDILLMDEVIWCTLYYEAPTETVPVSLVINMGEGIESQRILIQSERPDEFLLHSIPFLSVDDEVSLDHLQWSIDSLTFSETKEELELVMLIENRTSGVVSLEKAYRLMLHFKDSLGRRVPTDPFYWYLQLPPDLKPGEFSRFRVSLPLKSLQPPLFLFLKAGGFINTLSTVNAWLLPVE